MTNSTNTLPAGRRLFFSLYFFSGFCALVYEVLWTRMFTQILGATGVAVGLVLACFMLGLALGSYYWGRFIDCARSPAKLYAQLEIGIGLYSLLLPLLLKLAGKFYIYIYQGIHPSLSAVYVLQFIFSGVLLLVPTFLMGGTFPILVRLMVDSADSQVGANVSRLYAVNLLGAVLGSYIAGFWWIPAIGVTQTNLLAGVLNLFIGLTAYLYYQKIVGQPISEENKAQAPEAAPKRKRRPPVSKRLSYVILFIAAMTGFIALTYEVVWTRIISLIIDNTVYAVSLMLSTYLLGLFCGSIMISRSIDYKYDLVHYLAVFEIVLGLYGMLHIPLFGQVGAVFFQYKIDKFAGSWFSFVQGQFILCGAIMFIPTFLLGAIFPMAAKLYHIPKQAAGKLGTDMGLIYAVNTAGAVLGALGASLIFIPAIGSRRTIIIAALICIIMGLILAVINPRATTRKKIYTIVITFLLTWGGTQTIQSDIAFSEQAGSQEHRMIFRKEDTSSLIEVYEDLQGVKTLVSNRQQQEGSTSRISIYSQKKQGYLPLLIHPKPEYILNIGLGTGISLAPSINFSPELVECVELSEGIITANKFFAKQGNYVIYNPLVNLIKSDGRNYLLLTDKKYDVITADLFSPYKAGTGSLYTKEHYEQCKMKLRPGGIMCQWLPPHQLSPESLKIIIKTFMSVFPDTTLWLTRQSVALIGAPDGIKIDYAAYKAHFEVNKIKNDLTVNRLNDPYEFLTCFVMGGEDLAGFASGSSINTDNNPIIEFNTPKDFFYLSDEELYEQNLKELTKHRKQKIFPDYLKAPESVYNKLEEYYNARTHTIRAKIYQVDNKYTDAQAEFEAAYNINPNEPEAKVFLERHYLDKAGDLFRINSPKKAEAALKKVIEIEPLSIDAHMGLALLYNDNKDYKKAIEKWKDVLKLEPCNMEANGYIKSTGRKLTEK